MWYKRKPAGNIQVIQALNEVGDVGSFPISENQSRGCQTQTIRMLVYVTVVSHLKKPGVLNDIREICIFNRSSGTA